MSKFHPGDLCVSDIALTTREGSYGERIPKHWADAAQIELPPGTPMIIVHSMKDYEFAMRVLVLTQLGYVWTYTSKLSKISEGAIK